MTNIMPDPGGISEPKEADAEVQHLCDLIRADLERKVGKRFPEFAAVTFATQVVAGLNYFVKVCVESGQYVHVRIFQPLPGQGEPSLVAYQEDKTKDDKLEYF